MIKINLIPQVSKKKEELKRLLVFLTSLAIFFIAGVFFISIRTGSELSEKEKEFTLATLEYEAIEDKIRIVEKFKEMKKKLENKLGIIKNLKDKQVESVKVLDRLSDSVPPEVWIASIKDFEQLTIRGYSFSNLAIADFMQRLSKGGNFKDVKLLQSVRKEIDGGSIKEFQIVSSVNFENLKNYRNVQDVNLLESTERFPVIQMIKKTEMKVP